MVFICKHCNKEYSSQSSRSNHIKRFHKSEVVIPVVVVENVVKNVVKNNICKKCNKTLADRISRWKHEKICIEKDLEKEHDEIKKKLLEKDKEMIEFKKQMEKEMEKLKDIIQKSLKIHPKTLHKINTQLNNSGTINNITIVQLGKENLSELLTKQEKLGILNRQAMGINDIVELAHTSGKYKKCMNVYITNLQNTIGYMYDEKQNNFIAVNKNELLNDLLDSRMYDIEKFYEEFQEKIDKNKGDKIKKFIDRMNNDEDCLKGLKKEEIKLILYNNKEAIGTILPKTKLIDETIKELVI
jgi:seryl-tRNA synthetase